MVYKSSGYVKRFGWKGNLKEKKYIHAYSPKKINGRLDGYLIARTSSNPPKMRY